MIKCLGNGCNAVINNTLESKVKHLLDKHPLFKINFYDTKQLKNINILFSD